MASSKECQINQCECFWWFAGVFGILKLMTKASERRQRVRIPVESQIRHSQYQVLGTPIFEENSAIDLSASGVAFRTKREYKKGNLVLLEVQVESEPLKLLVCVAWTKPKSKDGTYEVGAELIAVDPVHKRKMQTHLTRLISEVQQKKKSARPAKAKTARAKINEKSKLKTKAKEARRGVKKTTAKIGEKTPAKKSVRKK